MNRGTPRLGEAALSFLFTLSPQKGLEHQQEVNRFVMWYGKELSLDELTAGAVGDYAEWVAASFPEPQKNLSPVKAFLTYIKKAGMTEANLAIHLKAKKGVPKALAVRGRATEPVVLTPEGYEQVQEELRALKEDRFRLREEVQKARADKDFRENAPLEAAREHQAQVEARIRELESALRSAAVLNKKPHDAVRVTIGSTIILCDLSSGERASYTLVNPREANPTKGKISFASPVGKALLERTEEEIVEVNVPLGKLRYRIERVQQ